MNKHLGFLLFALLSTTQVAKAITADLSLMQNLVGRYPVMDFNGNTQITGVLEIVGDSAAGVGFRVVDLVQDSSTVLAPQDLLTPVATTVLTNEGDRIVQEHREENLFVRVEFSNLNGQVGVHATRCPKNGNCELVQVNSTNEPGTLVDSAEFFKREAGAYRIESVGGEAPHDGNDLADVADGGSEANLTFPYCPNAGGLCDPGYLDLAYSDTKVYKKEIAPTHVIFTIQAGTRKYTWENRDGRVHFRNYQYQLASGQVIVLTHVMHKTR